MLANLGVLKTTTFNGVIESESFLKPHHGRFKRNIVTDLLLTALIDAFSILVIFLLMSFSSAGELLSIGKGQELPKAALGDVLERNPVVRVEEGTIFLEDKEIVGDGLVAAMLDLRKQYAELHPGEEYPGIITIQADRRVKYEQLNQIVVSASHAGFSDVRFAVLMK